VKKNRRKTKFLGHHRKLRIPN